MGCEKTLSVDWASVDWASVDWVLVDWASVVWDVTKVYAINR